MRLHVRFFSVLLMSVGADQKIKLYEFGPFRVDPEKELLLRGNETIPLTPKTFQILLVLIRHGKEVVTKDDLMKQVWPDTFVEEANLGRNIFLLRKALGESPQDHQYIITVPGRGYRLAESVRLVPEQELNIVAASHSKVQVQVNSHVPWPRYLLLFFLVVVVVGTIYFLKSGPPKLEVAASAQITSDGRPKLRLLQDPTALVTDGARIYFTEQPISLASPRQVSTAGGESVPLVTPYAGAYILDISRSGSELLIAEQNAIGPNLPIWILPVPSGSPRRVGGVFANDAGFSPDGDQIVYTTVDELYRIRRDGKEGQRLLVRKDFLLHAPRWSPDGSRIRFTMADPHTPEAHLWEIRADGSHLRPVLPDQPAFPRDCCGSWTKDGQWFVFLRSAQRSGSRGAGDVWALPEKRIFHRAAKPIQLTNGPLRFSRVVPDPSGSTLFVVSRQPRSELVRYDIKSGRLISILPELSILWANFSRDGQWISYESEPEGTLWRSRVDGSDRRQLTYPPMRSYQPQWSPDGKRIAFVGIEVGRPYKIYVASAQDGKLDQVTDGTVWDGDPNWSPDGDSLIFGRFPPSSDPQARHAMVINRVDVRSKQVSVVPGSNGLRSASWSPSGRYISASTEDMSTLMLFDLHTQQWRQLAKLVAAFPHWSKDERYIYFVNGDSERQPAILRVRVPEGTVERVVSLQGIRSPLGFAWSGLAPDGSPTTVRDVGTQGVYALKLREK